MENNIVVIKNRQAVTSSRQVAEHFGKRHDKLTHEIKRMYGELIGTAQNGGHPLFIENEYIHPQNRQVYKEYLMNRDGFSLLVMGFTGKEALEWKLKYINAFNEMEETLKSGEQLSEKDRLRLALFSKDSAEVAYAHQKLVELEVGEATAPLIETIEEQQPKVEYYETVLNTDSALTTTQIAQEFGMTAIKLNTILNTLGIQYKQSKQWHLKGEYKEKGYAVQATYLFDENKSKQTLKWTQKGRQFIIEQMNKIGHYTVSQQRQQEEN